MRWAVVGGGMMGMTLALRLQQAGHDVTLYESAPEFGGLASAWTLGDLVWDRHYHVTLLSDSYTRGLLEELGLDHELRWVETKTGLFADGRLHSMSNSLEYLRLPVLGMLDKLRLAATILYASRIEDGRRLERVTVEEWLTRCSGRRTFARLWKPLLRSKLGDAYRSSSAAFIWTTIRRLYAARRSGLKKEMFGYVRGGYGRTLTRFAERLAEGGVDLRTSSRVEALRSEGAELTVEATGQLERFDRAVVTTPPRVAARICPQLAGEERERFERVAYQGIVCASVLLRRPLVPFYLTYLMDEELPFTGVVEMSTFVDRAEFGGRSLVYLPKYVGSDDPLFEASDDSIRTRFLAGLERMCPDLDLADVECFQVSRVREVFPLPTLHYSDTLPPRETAIPGVRFVNSAQIVHGTLNVNDTLRLAEAAAKELCAAREAATGRALA